MNVYLVFVAMLSRKILHLDCMFCLSVSCPHASFCFALQPSLVAEARGPKSCQVYQQAVTWKINQDKGQSFSFPAIHGSGTVSLIIFLTFFRLGHFQYWRSLWLYYQTVLLIILDHLFLGLRRLWMLAVTFTPYFLDKNFQPLKNFLWNIFELIVDLTGQVFYLQPEDWSTCINKACYGFTFAICVSSIHQGIVVYQCWVEFGDYRSGYWL